jgi:hypothetical protein
MFGSVKTANGIAGLRDLTPTDVPAIIDYWLLSPDEHLDVMGVDRQLLGSKEDIQARFLGAVPGRDSYGRSKPIAFRSWDHLG